MLCQERKDKNEERKSNRWKLGSQPKREKNEK
jgi:hypothetical protein